MASSLLSSLFRIWHHLSYANTVETAVLLVILYDIIWHRLNAIREINRDKEAEAKRIQREEAVEKRQIHRERQEFIRKHWQELESNLILLHRITSGLMQQKGFVEKNSDAQDATTRHVLTIMAGRFPEVMAEFDDRWARVVAQLNVFPEPRPTLALEVLKVVQELGETAKDKRTEVNDETLLALAHLAKRVAEAARLPNVDD